MEPNLASVCPLSTESVLAESSSVVAALAAVVSGTGVAATGRLGPAASARTRRRQGFDHPVRHLEQVPLSKASGGGKSDIFWSPQRALSICLSCLKNMQRFWTI